MTPPDRVRSSAAAMLVSGLLWLLLPTGYPTILWGIAVGVTLADPPRHDVWATVVALALFALPSVPLWWLWWRYAGVSARRLVDTIRVRGFRRTEYVPWNRVRTVTATGYVGSERGFNFAWTVITYTREDGAERSVRVSRSFRSSTIGCSVIRSWFPPRHSQYQPFPEVAEFAGDLTGEPVLESLRPPVVIRALHTFALAVILAPVVIALVPVLGELSGDAGWTVFALLLVLALAVAWFVLRIWTARLDLTTEGLVSRGYLRTRSYPVAAVQGFDVAPSGAGGMVSMTLAAQGTRQLVVGAGFGGHPEQVRERLESWRRARRGGGSPSRGTRTTRP